MNYFELLPSPAGTILVVVDTVGALLQLHTGVAVGKHPSDGICDPSKTAEVRTQLNQYFAGTRQDFDLPINPIGSEFQHQVWHLLRQIPFGETRTYGDIAKQLGLPNSSRAVGRANATNPISIVVPCHRVIGAAGALTGYAGGLDTKRWLLEFEGAIPPQVQDALF